MSAFLKALGVYLLVVAALGAWIGGIAWVITTDQDNPIASLVVLAPVVLILVLLILALAVLLPIASLYDYFKESTK